MSASKAGVSPSPAKPSPGMALLSNKEKYSYVSGEIASNVTWNMIAGFLLFYYSDVALLPVAALGTLMLVTRVLDALFDPAVGLLVDRTQTRMGKARPYIFWSALPFGVLTVITFSVPEFLTPDQKVVFAYITFTLLGLLYSLLYIPYSAMLPMMTRHPAEKLQLGSYRSMATSIASIFVYGLTMPLVLEIGGDDKQWGFTVTSAIMAGVTTILFFVVVANCRERIGHEGPVVHVPVLRSLTEVARNPVWRIVFAFALIIFIRIGVLVSSIAFFAKDILEKPSMMSVLLPLLSVAILVGGFLASHLFRFVTKRKGNIIAILLTLVPICFMPLAESRPEIFLPLFVLINISGGIQAATCFILLADSVECHESRFGNRAEGVLVSSVSFGMKVGMAIGAAITAYTLGWFGYDPAQSTATANTALSWLFYGSPFVSGLCLLVCIAFLKEPDPRASAA